MKEKTALKELVIDGTTIAAGVPETIVSMAVAEVDGVAGVGEAGTISSIVSNFRSGKNPQGTGIGLTITEDLKVTVALTIQAYYGYRLADVAENVRKAIGDAMQGQLGLEVVSVDLNIDAIQAKE